MDTLLSIALVQLLNLILFARFNRTAVFQILALRQQLAVYKRKRIGPRLKNRDRLFWAVLSRLWKDWASSLVVVKPETVIRWRGRKFIEFWRRKSSGRPPIPAEHIAFIRRISSDHPEYGEDRIALELEIKLGIRHSPSTIRRYMVERPSGPRITQSWGTFLRNQAKAIWSADFFVQFTIRFKVVYVFIVMEIESRRIVHFNVTENPTLEWTKQQIRNVCVDDQPKFIIHDNDGKYGQYRRPLCVKREGKKASCRSAFDVWLVEIMNIRGIPIPYGAPNASAHIERLIGTIRRECLDHMLIWNERHLRRILSEFIRWYNRGRVHQGIRGIPEPNPSLAGPKPEKGRMVAIPILGGLHHDYRLVA